MAQDRVEVAKMIVNGIDINRRDQVGRTPLHVAIISKSVDIACDLIDAGARMTWRLLDGRTSLHLAAQLDLPVLVGKLLQRSEINKEKAEKAEVEKGKGNKEVKAAKGETQTDGEQAEDIRDSSEDDWDSEESDPPVVVKKPPVKTEPKPDDGSDILDDKEDTPDVFDINAPDWDHAFTPLSYAILYASLPVVEALLAAGANVHLVTKAQGYQALALHPLSLTMLVEDEVRAAKVAERLLLAGASSSEADSDMCTIFYRAVSLGKTKLASVFLRFDPNAASVINFPSLHPDSIRFPIVAAVANGSYSMLALLLAHGAKLNPSEEDVTKAKVAQ
jgi:ankyrin repeat protein